MPVFHIVQRRQRHRRPAPPYDVIEGGTTVGAGETAFATVDDLAAAYSGPGDDYTAGTLYYAVYAVYAVEADSTADAITAIPNGDLSRARAFRRLDERHNPDAMPPEHPARHGG